MKVAVLMGSDSDWPVMQGCVAVLKEFGVAFEAKVTSAHRTPVDTHNYVKDAEARGCQVFIAAAGMAAHLAGTVAGLTTKPVIGVPLATTLHGMDALLSTVQMPGGIPVACMGIDKAGAKNAAILAVEMLALSSPDLAEKLKNSRDAMRDAVAEKNAKLQEQL